MIPKQLFLGFALVLTVLGAGARETRADDSMPAPSEQSETSASNQVPVTANIPSPFIQQVPASDEQPTSTEFLGGQTLGPKDGDDGKTSENPVNKPPKTSYSPPSIGDQLEALQKEATKVRIEIQELEKAIDKKPGGHWDIFNRALEKYADALKEYTDYVERVRIDYYDKGVNPPDKVSKAERRLEKKALIAGKRVESALDVLISKKQMLATLKEHLKSIEEEIERRKKEIEHFTTKGI